MVCVACLLPLFLIPVASALPILFDFIMAKIYALFGWEYVKPVRAPPACPYKPAANNKNKSTNAEQDPAAVGKGLKVVGDADSKND